MTREQLERKTNAVVEETRAALQKVYDELNRGQQQKIVKDEAVRALFDRYGVVYDEEVRA